MAQTPAPRLIVTGDDMGRSEGVTRGIVEAHRHGILTNASLLANGPCFELSVELLKANPDLAVGVHLAIDEVPPVADPGSISTLLDSDGRFHARSRALLGIQLGRIRLEHVEREWDAQIRKLRDAGLRPSHLDGHGGCQGIPRAARIVRDLAVRHGIGAVRVTAEPLSYLGGAKGFPARRYLQKCLVRGAAELCGRHWRDLRTVDNSFGFMDVGWLRPQTLESLARSLRSGVYEFVSHPGTENRDPFGWDFDFRNDLEALLAWSKPEFEERFPVRLVSYRDAWNGAGDAPRRVASRP